MVPLGVFWLVFFLENLSPLESWEACWIHGKLVGFINQPVNEGAFLADRLVIGETQFENRQADEPPGKMANHAQARS